MNKPRSENSINAGQKTIEWLYREQLKIDDQWSVRRKNGFTWWADKNAQTIEIIGSEQHESGDTAYLVSVRTEFLHNVDLTPRALEGLNALVMPFASMAGPVYDPKTRSISLCSLVKVHEGIRAWMSLLISTAAVLQVAEARMLDHRLAAVFGGELAETRHPRNGRRPEADELADITEQLIVPVGRQPSKWMEPEFETAVEQHMQRPPSLGASGGGAGFTVEFPYGDGSSSLCQFKADEPHPRYGNGLFMLQSFPVGNMAGTEGTRLALELNARELTKNPAGYGFGSFCYGRGMLHFAGFLPNLSYRKGLLPNLYYTCASRAFQASRELAER